jgi:hypothetical protein
MWTILDSISGLVLFAKFDNKCLEGQTAINQICSIEGDMPKYWDFENEFFYIKP